MSKLHLSHISFLTPLLKQLDDAGAPVSKYLKKSGLDRFRVDEADTFIPIAAFEKLVEIVKEKEGTKNTASVFSSAYVLENLGDWGEGVAHCPDLLSACRGAQQTAPMFQTNQRMWLELMGNKAKFHHTYQDIDGEINQYLEVSSLMCILDGFHLGCGADWVPLEIHTTLPSLDEYASFMPVDQCIIKCQQPSFGIVFWTKDLASKMKVVDPQSSAKLQNLQPEATLISEKIERLLDAAEQGPLPNLEMMVDYTEFSSRSLQRQLADEGSSYFQVIDDWRFKKSMELLSDPSLKLNNIAEQLHYAHATNFIRAFKRRTNISPTEFRETLFLT